MKFILCFFLALFLTLCSCNSHKTSEVLEFKDSIYYFDTIQAQREESHFQFTYFNRGSKPLYLTEAKAECSCTMAEISTEALAPGDSAYIDVYYQSYTQYFDIFQSITVKYYYDDQEAEKRVFIRGYVIPFPFEVVD